MNKPIYLPPFLQAPNTDFDSVKADDCWLTVENLEEESNKPFPGPDDIGEKNRASFTNHTKVLFPIECKFASYIQLLKEAVNMILKAWGPLA
jgi:hypothetical protein